MGQKTSDSNAGRIAPLSDGVHFQVRKPEDKPLTITTPKETATIRGISPESGLTNASRNRLMRTRRSSGVGRTFSNGRLCPIQPRCFREGH